MTFETLSVAADDDTRLAAYRWPAAGGARAILVIVHGMAEHARRYDVFAQTLARAGIDVHAFDLRGHGETTGAIDHGHIEAANGWAALIGDVARMRTHALETVGRRPVFVLGHSLGSYIVQAVLAQRGAGYAGAILSAPALPSRLACRFGAALAGLEAGRVDATGSSRVLQWLTVGDFARRARRRDPSARGPFDWLSREAEAVNAYARDPACGFALRTRSWRQLLTGIARIRTPHIRRQIPARLPMLLIAGSADVVGRCGRHPQALARALVNDGQHDLTLRLYHGARHELLHDRLATTVTMDVQDWIDDRLRRARARELMSVHPE